MDNSGVPTGIRVRPATVADVPVLARHCVEMYADMGVLPPDCRARLLAAAETFIAAALPSGDYLAWVATPDETPRCVVGGAGLHLRRGMPRLRKYGSATEVTTGPQGVVCNVYTERDWRRRGIAATLIRAVLTWTEACDVPHVFLHASANGRPLYEQLGFVSTNEMRYAGAPAT